MGYNVNFYCRQSKANKKGFAKVQACVQIGEERIFINLPRQERPEEFAKCMKSKKATPIRDYCDSVQRRFGDICQELMEKNIPLTASILKEYWERGGASQPYTLNDMWNAFLTIKHGEIGVSIEQETYDRYIIARDRFYEYTGLSHEYLAKDVSQEHILNFRSKVFKSYSDDAGGNLISRVKGAFRLAFESGKIRSTPFAGIKLTRGAAHNNGGDIKYLTETQLNQIRDKEFSTERLQKVADCFCFACFTGMSFIDMKQLEPNDFLKTPNGQYYIKKKRKKTGVEFTTMLFSDALVIAQKYDFRLPVLSNQKYNEYLHEIQTICEIPITLTSHVARHTAATYMLQQGITTEVLQKIFGWTNERMAHKYAKVLDETIFTDLQKIGEEQFRKDCERIILGKQ